ncbi:Protein of unknown function [Bacillus toyonensis]|nr:Protein of unknown function [Bacillus cereus]SCN20426.1 Protein of unknown function [Bacillus toyonensis]
MFEDSE